MTKKHRPRVSREEWARRVKRWQDSGVRAKEFARELNINAGTLQQWKYQFEGERRGTRAVPGERSGAGQGQGAKSESFVELTAPVCARAGFELNVGEYRLQVPAGFDEVELRKLLGVVSSLR